MTLRHALPPVAALLCATPCVHGQTPPPDDDAMIVVVGKRASLATALGIKRDARESVDAVVADDIQKLPDISVTEALQRVTGVQIARDRGEGGAVTIRGLAQMETTLNGREIFTAGWGRNLDFSDIPAELVSAIQVYKTSAAEHIEGGVGGLVDLRTRRPFDFKGREIAAAARRLRGDLVGDGKNQYSLLASDRWKTHGGGEFGALLNIARQERAWREDQKSVGAPLARTDLVPGQTVLAPNGATETASRGTRRRDGAHLVLQWRPTDALDLYAEASRAKLLTFQNSYQFNAWAPGAGAFLPGGTTLFPGTGDVRDVTWTAAPLSSYGAARDTIDRTAQWAIGGSWLGQKLTLKADLSRTISHNDLAYTAIALNGTAATLTQNLSGAVPGSSVGGTDLDKLGGFATAGMIHAGRPFDGKLDAARLDAEYRLSGDYLEALSAGIRLARRHASDSPGQIFFSPTPVPASHAAALAILNPVGGFFPGDASVSGYLLGAPELARDLAALRAALGIAATIPASNPLGIWNIDEETQSAHVMAQIRALDLPLDGNAGVRVVRTRESVSGYRSMAGGVAPIARDHAYTDLLPSLNLRYELAHGLYLRGAASKTLTRPDFNQLSPSLTLNPVQRTGVAGNPELRPVRADNLDFALERYFGKTAALHAAVFIKKVDGFVLTATAPETHDGIDYQVGRPHNANTADIKGLELGYQQFYDFLPGWLGGLGLQANYTYVDSKTPSPILGRDVPLQNLSRHSLNLVGMYERGPVSARVAGNWRDKFLSGTQSVAGVGALPVYTKAYGWLDASLAYRIDANLSLAIEGLNLLRTRRQAYYGVETRPQSAWLNDRQIGLVLSLRLK